MFTILGRLMGGSTAMILKQLFCSAFGRCVALMALSSVLLSAQTTTAGETTRPGNQGQSNQTQGTVFTGKGEAYQVSPQKAKAIVTAIDVVERTITVKPAKDGDTFRVADVGPEGRTWRTVAEMKMTFITPSGMEKIALSKSASKAVGKKSISLEELRLQSEIKVEYYPAAQAILSLTVERAGS
jgi:hypothetical protein